MKEIVRELEARGYEVREAKVNRNGVQLSGVVIGKGENIRPSIYKTEAWDSMSTKEVCDHIEKLYEENKREDIDVNSITSPEYLAKNTFLCLQHDAPEGACKRAFLDMVLVLRCKVEEGTYIVPDRLYSDELWNAATENTKKSVSFENFYGMPVLTNKERVHGAYIDAEIAAQFCIDNGVNSCYIIPSSIHELILLADAGMDLDYINSTICDVNENEVDATDRLSGHAYRYDIATNEFTY